LKFIFKVKKIKIKIIYIYNNNYAKLITNAVPVITLVPQKIFTCRYIDI
jgi:hypothetical protein